MAIITDPIQRLRLEVFAGSDSTLLSDDQLETLLAERDDDILTAAADACDILATRFATDYDIEWQGSANARGKLSRSQVAKMFADRAKTLRQRAEDEGDIEIVSLPTGVFDRRRCGGL